MTGSDETGQPTKGKIRLEMKGPDEFIFTATNSTVGTQSQPDSQLRFRKLSPGRGRYACVGRGGGT